VKNYLFAFVLGAILTSCSSDKKESIAPLSVEFDSKVINKSENIVYTKSNKAKLTIKSSEGSIVYLNGNFLGRVSDGGSFSLELPIDHIGSTNYDIKIVDLLGNEIVKSIEVIRVEPTAKLGVIKTKGEAQGLTLSQNGFVFIAESKSGVEIMNIGYNDEISSKNISSISNIDATKVTLSSDEKTLFIKDDRGLYHKFDLSDISNPVEVSVVDKVYRELSSINSDNTLKLKLTPCGLVCNGGNDFSKREFIIKDKLIKDAIFIDSKHFLVAHSNDGLWLYSVENGTPILLSKRDLGGNTTGLSLIKKDGILFVANGEKGVEIFNIDILLHDMKKGI